MDPVEILDVLNARLLEQQSALLDANFATNSGNAQAQHALDYDKLFAQRAIGYRNLANSYGVAGLGDSGFAARGRREFGEDQSLKRQQLDLNLKKTIDALTQGRQSAQLRLAADFNEILANAQANSVASNITIEELLAGLIGLDPTLDRDLDGAGVSIPGGFG